SIGNIGEALGAFIEEITSGNSRFDKAQNFSLQLTPQEQVGQKLFFEKYQCNNCHQTQTPTGYQHGGSTFAFVDIGLDANPADKGRAAFTNDVADIGKFKIPSLRNIGL